MKKLSKIEKFQIFCLESYRQQKMLSGLDAFNEFSQFNVFDYLSDGYEVLHTQGRDYLIADIYDFISQRNLTKI